MDERTTLEIIAPSVDEALAQGLAQLGLPADAVTVEVLDTGTKGFLGLGGRQVRVRLSVIPTGDIDFSMPAAAPAPTPAPKPARAPRAAAAAPAEAEAPVGEVDGLTDRTEALISKLLFHLGLQAQVSAHYGEPDREGRLPIHVDIRGDDLGVLIGRRSETLNAFQYVAALIVSKEAGKWVQLIVDVEGYRDRRERQLRQMARRMAEQALKTGRRQVLEPMPASERRIIHLELRGHPGVTTESTGDDPARKVTIVPRTD